MSSETKSRAGLDQVKDWQGLAIWLRANALPPYKELLSALGSKVEELASSADTGGREAALTEQQVERIHQIIEQYSTDVIDYAIATDDINAFLERSADPGTTGAEGLEPQTFDPFKFELTWHEKWRKETEGTRPLRYDAHRAFLQAVYDEGRRAATQRAPVMPPAPDIAAYYRGVEAAVELLRAYKLPSQAERNTNVKTMNEYIEEIAKDILAHRESAQAYAECGPAAAPAPVTTPGRDELRAAAEWIVNDANFKAPEQIGPVAERWVDRLNEALAAAKEPRG